MNFVELISQTLNLETKRVSAAVSLFDDGSTVPFIARYRKDQTGELDEIQLRDIEHKYEYFKELFERKQTVVNSIQEQGKMTPELLAKIESCIDKTVLEDLYLPYKPKRRTKATVARENGLEPLARIIEAQEASTNTADEIALIYCSEEKGIGSSKVAIEGALDILAEEISENAEYRQYLRQLGEAEGILTSEVRKEFEGQQTKFENYYNFSERVSRIPSHRVLAIRRGEKEKVLRIGLQIDDARCVSYLQSRVIKGDSIWKTWLESCCQDAWDRLLKPSIETEVRLISKNNAEIEAFKVFGKNLRDVLLAAPAGHKSVLALDPGFRSGVKVAVMDNNGKFIHHTVVYPHTGGQGAIDSAKVLKNIITEYNIELIAIGNGTASRETDAFVAQKVLPGLTQKPVKVIVNESGASVYSASEEAIKEFPNEDVTTRGAISIGRRLQDPLAELVKVDPKSIGVGQYQHDVSQTQLKKSLDEVVETCVNMVGVDINTASASLLSYVSGISKNLSLNIVKHREQHGAFAKRKNLLDVTGFGPKAFEQSAGFLRIIDGEEALDGSAVHPEHYGVVENIAKDLGVDVKSLIGNKELIRSIELDKYISEKVGKIALQDILAELEKPNRDPRAEFRYASFNDKIQSINDLITNSWMEGVVSNVTNFGAFVDIGVHQDGLIHISELSGQFVTDAKEFLKVGDIVRVRVVAVDVDQKRIALSMKAEGEEVASKGKGIKGQNAPAPKAGIQQHATIADLKQKLKGKNPQDKKADIKPVKPQISMKSLMKSGR